MDFASSNMMTYDQQEYNTTNANSAYRTSINTIHHHPIHTHTPTPLSNTILGNHEEHEKRNRIDYISYPYRTMYHQPMHYTSGYQTTLTITPNHQNTTTISQRFQNEEVPVVPKIHTIPSIPSIVTHPQNRIDEPNAYMTNGLEPMSLQTHRHPHITSTVDLAETQSRTSLNEQLPIMQNPSNTMGISLEQQIKEKRFEKENLNTNSKNGTRTKKRKHSDMKLSQSHSSQISSSSSSSANCNNDSGNETEDLPLNTKTSDYEKKNKTKGVEDQKAKRREQIARAARKHRQRQKDELEALRIKVRELKEQVELLQSAEPSEHITEAGWKEEAKQQAAIRSRVDHENEYLRHTLMEQLKFSSRLKDMFEAQPLLNSQPLETLLSAASCIVERDNINAEVLNPTLNGNGDIKNQTKNYDCDEMIRTDIATGLPPSRNDQFVKPQHVHTPNMKSPTLYDHQHLPPYGNNNQVFQSPAPPPLPPFVSHRDSGSFTNLPNLTYPNVSLKRPQNEVLENAEEVALINMKKVTTDEVYMKYGQK